MGGHDHRNTHYALAAQHGMDIVGCAKGFNVLRDGDLITADSTPSELEQWLEGYDGGKFELANTIVDQLLDAAFNVPRDPRSDQYKAGARAALMFRIDGTPILQAYAAGSAKADAFTAGIEEGHAIWRRTLAAAGAA